MEENRIQIEFGALSPKLAEQLKGCNIPKRDLMYFQRDADAITRLNIRDLIPDATVRRARQKLVNRIAKTIK